MFTQQVPSEHVAGFLPGYVSCLRSCPEHVLLFCSASACCLVYASGGKLVASTGYSSIAVCFRFPRSLGISSVVGPSSCQCRSRGGCHTQSHRRHCAGRVNLVETQGVRLQCYWCHVLESAHERTACTRVFCRVRCSSRRLHAIPGSWARPIAPRKFLEAFCCPA